MFVTITTIINKVILLTFIICEAIGLKIDLMKLFKLLYIFLIEHNIGLMDIFQINTNFNKKILWIQYLLKTNIILF